MTTWPGDKMSSVKDNSYGLYIPKDAKYIIFSDGNGTKTDDLTLAGLDKIYNNGSWSDYGDDVIIPVDNNVYYKNTNNWSNVYAYYWSDSNTKMTTWPGVQMTSAGNGTYKIEVPSDAKYIIFNNGNGSQTGDITLNGTGKIYNNGNWSNY